MVVEIWGLWISLVTLRKDRKRFGHTKMAQENSFVPYDFAVPNLQEKET